MAEVKSGLPVACIHSTLLSLLSPCQGSYCIFTWIITQLPLFFPAVCGDHEGWAVSLSVQKRNRRAVQSSSYTGGIQEIFSKWTEIKFLHLLGHHRNLIDLPSKLNKVHETTVSRHWTAGTLDWFLREKPVKAPAQCLRRGGEPRESLWSERGGTVETRWAEGSHQMDNLVEYRFAYMYQERTRRTTRKK